MRLVTPDLRLLDAALEGDEALAREMGTRVVPGWVSFGGALRLTRNAIAADPASAEWGTRLFVTEDPEELVGWGGFKGPPDDGVVEVGYEIAASHRGRGLATDAVTAMLGHAFDQPGVTAAIAHTLPEHNASTRVLEKSGFRHDGETREGGQRVWRWRREGDAGPAG
jgi:[ribosomal protein S5]-alanine N-acetyltransferase